MKYIQSINEWFGKKYSEIDDMLKNIIRIIKEENIKITQGEIVSDEFGPIYDESYSVDIDDVLYKICQSRDYSESYIEFDNKNIKIPNKYFRQIANLYFNQAAEREKLKEIERKKEKEKIIKNLPNLSDEGRAAKKYNI